MVLVCKGNRRSGSRSAFIEASPPQDPAHWLRLWTQIETQAAGLDRWMLEAAEGAVRGGCPGQCKFMSGGWTHRIDVNQSFQWSTSPPLRVVLRVDLVARWEAYIYCDTKDLDVPIIPAQLAQLRLPPLAEYPWDDFQKEYP
jgi:hypothetical protein